MENMFQPSLFVPTLVFLIRSLGAENMHITRLIKILVTRTYLAISDVFDVDLDEPS